VLQLELVLYSQKIEKKIAYEVRIANTFITRLQGWMGKQSATEGEALVISPCSSIHTFGMKFAIDVLFLNSNDQVIHRIQNLKPNRVSRVISSASKVIELRAGTIEQLDIKLQDEVRFLT
jgi:uncharacterized membrane protein (UPF0127 family)